MSGVQSDNASEPYSNHSRHPDRCRTGTLRCRARTSRASTSPADSGAGAGSGTSAASARASGRGRVAATPAAQPAKAADAARALELRRPARSAAQILGRQAYAPGWGALRAVFSCLAHHVRA